MTFLQRYEDFYGQYRQKFEDTEVPKALATLSADARRRVENGEGEFPIELLAEVRDGELEEKQKIATMTAIAGTWSNAASDTYWHAGPWAETRSPNGSELDSCTQAGERSPRFSSALR